jgi:hypothetical protein
MLDSDHRDAAEEESAQFADVPVPQFWDGKKLLGWEVSRSFGITDRAAWDIYLFYPPGAEWTDAGLPPAEKAIAQARGGVIGIKGTLPPKGDQSRVPEWGKGLIDIVGQPPELAALLSAIAVPYVERYQSDRLGGDGQD